MNEPWKKILILFTCIWFLSGTGISYAGSSEFKVMCEGIRKDIGSGLAQNLTKIELEQLEKLVTISVYRKNLGFAVESQLPFFKQAEYLFEEFHGDQRGLYFKNAREKLFVALLVESNETTIYYVTYPFDSFSNESWDGATHLSLRCNEDSPMG